MGKGLCLLCRETILDREKEGFYCKKCKHKLPALRRRTKVKISRVRSSSSNNSYLRDGK